MNSPLWRLQDVTVPGRGRPRLDRITVEIPSGVTAVLGPSGAGKTTLLNLLVGFETNYTGTISRTASTDCGPHSPSAERRHMECAGHKRLPVFWVPPGHGLWPHLTVRLHLASLLPGSKAAQGTAADHLLDDFDLQPLAQAYPATLSQGERDRVSLARAIASGASVLILDEPLAHVPADAALRYWSRLRTACQEQRMSIVMATHDRQVALREANSAITLELGRVSFCGDVKDLPACPASNGG